MCEQARIRYNQPAVVMKVSRLKAAENMFLWSLALLVFGSSMAIMVHSGKL